MRKQDGINLSGIQMFGLSCTQMAFENQTIWHPTSFQPFKYQTSLGIQIPTILRYLNDHPNTKLWTILFYHSITRLAMYSVSYCA